MLACALRPFVSPVIYAHGVSVECLLLSQRLDERQTGPLRATPNEKDRVFSRTPSPDARPSSLRQHLTQSFDGPYEEGYPECVGGTPAPRNYNEYSYRWQYGCTYSDDEEEYGAHLSAQYHAGWE